MFPFSKKPVPAAAGLSRREALALCPTVSRDVDAKETASGLVRLSLPVAVRPALAGLARRLGLWDGKVLRRTVELDAMGSAVWRLIDGRRTAGEIAAALAGRYRLDPREAELAVAEFLRQLGRRGAVAVAEKGGAGEGRPPAAGRG
ncbi:PqqD family protein [Solidesulfovibrio sp.]|uniref:PqqD family protein n=1 Tax=Solidesulfovibrio sp. TaxID=2910990 RepID=UPI0026180A9E|nr:PqqD family protein [Solidesulfovibrio sp.]